jgi:hypothetical protein
VFLEETAMLELPIISDSIYVFYQAANYPNYVSFIRYDSSTAIATDQATLFGMELAFGPPWQSNPKACYYANKIYVFGRTPGNQISAMQFDGAQIAGPISGGDGSITCASASPCVLNGQLYIFFSAPDAGNSTVVRWIDANLQTHASTSSNYVHGYRDISPYPPKNGNKIVAWGNIEGQLYPFIYNVSEPSIFPGSNNNLISNINYDPCAMPFNNINNRLGFDFMAYAMYCPAGGGLAVGSVTGDSFSIDGVSPSSSPSVISLGDDANYLVFYADGDSKRTLKVASVYIDFANSEGSVNSITDFQIPLAPANCSPCAVLIP